MNIERIKIVDKDTIIITTTDGDNKWFKKEELSVPCRTWFDNILACSKSLFLSTEEKN